MVGFRLLKKGVGVGRRNRSVVRLSDHLDVHCFEKIISDISGIAFELSIGFSDVRARLGSARPDDGLRKSKPEPQALKSLSRPKPWAQAAALHT